MTVQELAGPLQAEIVVKGNGTGPVRGVVASDLMSDVLVATQDDALLVTSLASEQMIRTADLVGAAGVVIVNNKPLAPGLTGLARTLDMPLLRSPLAKYEACLAIGASLAAAP